MAIVNPPLCPGLFITLEESVVQRGIMFNIFHIYEQLQPTRIYFLLVFRTGDRTLVREYTIPPLQKVQLLPVLLSLTN
jgi:hypothetical protein